MAQGCKAMFQPDMFGGGGRGGGGGRMAEGWEMLSGKMAVAASMLAQLRATTSDRIVIVSNYTQARPLATCDRCIQRASTDTLPFGRIKCCRAPPRSGQGLPSVRHTVS